MTDQEKQAAEEQVKQAEERLFQEVYVPTFVERLAEHGIVLDTPEKVAEALDLTANLREYRDRVVKENSEKVASLFADLKRSVKVASAELE